MIQRVSQAQWPSTDGPDPTSAQPDPADRRSRNEIFINLARRSQALVDRQLRLIDEMQATERDPDRILALHQLAQLAARMRRNDESLLVLAGAGTRRRGPESVPLAALVLAALGEIEQYERISAEVDRELHLAGHVGTDIVHLLAELLDNATTYSAPHSAVRVVARSDADGVLLEVTDLGIGMSPETLAELNAVLRDPPEVDESSSERMGLVVVGHLAARLGAQVVLTDGKPGIRATVRIPRQLLSDAEPELSRIEVTAPLTTKGES